MFNVDVYDFRRLVPERELRGLSAMAAAAAGTGVSTLISILGQDYVDRALLLGPYVPGLFLISLWAGRASGQLMAAANCLVIGAHFLRGQPAPVFAVTIAMVLVVSVLTHVGATGLRSTILTLSARERALTAAREAQDLLVGELHHRVKNLLAVVQSIASVTMRGANDLQSFRRQFEGRLVGLGRAQSALIAGGWSAIELEALLSEVLSPFESSVPGEGLQLIRGPSAPIGSDLAVALALVMHELATNATKHGGLRLEAGAVTCGWTAQADGVVLLEWKERNFAPLGARAGQGFGTELVSRLLGRFGESTVRMEPDGLYFALRFAIDADQTQAAGPAARERRAGAGGERGLMRQLWLPSHG